MAAQTFTATTTPDQPRNLDFGLNIATAKYVAPATSLSLSDVIQMIRLPEGATVVDGYVSGKCGATTSLVIKVGVGAAGANDAVFVSSVTISATTKLTRFDGNAGLPYLTPTIAAATYPKYNWLTITGVSGSVTASISLQVSVIYLTGNLSGL